MRTKKFQLRAAAHILVHVQHILRDVKLFWEKFNTNWLPHICWHQATIADKQSSHFLALGLLVHATKFFDFTILRLELVCAIYKFSFIDQRAGQRELDFRIV